MPKKIVVAIHGIGEQREFETIQTVAYSFCKYSGVPPAIPLGRFRPSDPTADTFAAFVVGPSDPGLSEQIGFAEVYWAGIPRKVVEKKYQLEEAKRWAQTIVGRLNVIEERKRLEQEARLKQLVKEVEQKVAAQQDLPQNLQREVEKLRAKARDRLSSRDYDMLQTVLGELIDTIRVLEQVSALAAKAGLFSFNLRQLLTDFVGDVQVVTEFAHERGCILDAFNRVMGDVCKAADHQEPPELYLIAHSEGSVVAFLGLLTALAQKEPPKWAAQVRGLLTIGSPIETHVVLWPGLWTDSAGEPLTAPTPPAGWKHIKWLNCYDCADPIAYSLKATRSWMKKHGWGQWFDANERAFSRYAFPGKAHVDYWRDEPLLGHFIQEVVADKSDDPNEPDLPARLKDTDYSLPPGNRPMTRVFANLFPYMVIAGLLMLAVYVLYKPVTDLLLAPAANAGRSSAAQPVEELKTVVMVRDIFGLALLMAGITVAVRIPRLTTARKWWALAGLGFALSWPACFWIVCDPTVLRIAKSIPRLEHATVTQASATLFVASALVVFFGSVLSRLFPYWGVRALPIVGGLAAMALVIRLVTTADRANSSLWPVVLGSLLFFYLWWLAALLFDLVFVWHRYVRYETAAWQLCELCGYADANAESAPSANRAPAPA